MTKPLQSPTLGSLAAATLVHQQNQFATSEVRNLANTEKFKAWQKLRDNPPRGHLDIGQAMRNIERAIPVQGELVHQVDLLFKSFIGLINTRFHQLFRPDEQWMVQSLHLSVLQSRLQMHYENAALETIWEERLLEEFEDLDAFDEIDHPIGHEEIRAWLNDPNNSHLVQQIEHLDLNCLQLKALPPEIGLFRGLRTLTLNENEIRTLPESIGNLHRLQKLYACYNLLEEIPDSIGNLKRLEALDLTANALTQVPIALCEAESLSFLELGENSIQSLPDEIEKLVNLTKLDLSDNCLKTIPDSIGNLPKLRRLELPQNELSALPNAFAQLQTLEWLELSDNGFQVFPEPICHLPNLRMLGIECNLISLVPQTVMTMPSLIGLYISGNPIVFMTDSELEQFSKPCLEEELLSDNSFATILARFREFYSYSCSSSFAKLVQAVGCGQSFDEVQEAFSCLDPSLQQAILSKIQELTEQECSSSSTALPEELPRDLLAECLKEVCCDRLEALNPDQQEDVSSKVWELYNTQDGPVESELAPEKDQLFAHVLRHIDAVELTINPPEDGREKKKQRTLNS
ncbi:MAG: leucine-rich repeat domain-containing protein [Verrucomicrobia bacterium]|nr:leucine-rich repeat domain-containing protein [Verrucomicrobiota bacterium]